MSYERHRAQLSRKAFDIMHAAFLRLRELDPTKPVDELVEKITKPPEIVLGVWRDVSYQYRRYARQLPPLYRAAVSPARNSDPDTSQIAALIDKSLRSRQRVEVLFALYSAGEIGATDFEISEKLKPMLRTSAGKRRKELVDVLLVESTKERRTTDTDSPAVVWRITRLGRKVVETMQAIQH